MNLNEFLKKSLAKLDNSPSYFIPNSLLRVLTYFGVLIISDLLNGDTFDTNPLNNTYQLAPIKVTAERRTTDLQKTPLALSAFSTKDINEYQINQVTDLSLITPGLTIGNNGNISTPEIFIRGVGSFNLSLGSDVSIASYVDDVYIGRGKAMFFELFDIESIEVLRGPQGTLYGRNTIGGALKIQTKQPTKEFSADHRLSIGNFDLFKFNGSISGPLLDNDRVRGRLAYVYKDRDGFSKNILANSRLADIDTYGGRGSIWFIGNENLDFLMSFDYSRDRTAGIAYKPIHTAAPLLPGHIEPNDPFDVNHDIISTEDRELFGGSGKITWVVNDVSIVSVSAARSLDFYLFEDVDGSSLPLIGLGRDLKQVQASEELRVFNSSAEENRWLFGAYFFTEDAEEITSLFSLGTVTANDVNLVARTYAVFGEGTYGLTDRLSITVGSRFTYEEKEFDLGRIFTNTQGVEAVVLPKVSDRESWRAFLPKFGLQFKESKDLLFYGTIARGFKSGGYDSFQLEATFQDSFDPEFVISYELGAKTRWFEDRLEVNASTFYNDHSDLQVQQTVAANVPGNTQLKTTNAAEAVDYGIEIEIKNRPMVGLDIGGSLAVLQSEYKDFINDDGIDVSEHPLIRSPKLSTNLVVQYQLPLTDFGDLIFRIEHQFQSQIYFTETKERILSQGDFHNLNARIAYKHEGGGFTFAIFGKNLTDEESINVSFDFRDQINSVIRAFNPPRTYGLECQYRF